MVEQLREKEQETLKLMSDVTHQSEYEIILALSNYFEAQLKFFEKGAALVSQTLPHLKAAVEKGVLIIYSHFQPFFNLTFYFQKHRKKNL